MAKEKYQNVRGTYDVLPAKQAEFRYATETFRDVASTAGYGFIDTPILEEAGVFNRTIGAGTDIVAKEMYALKDRSGDELALRPEGTAGVARAFIQHGMSSLPKPVRLAYIGPMFRYERPQAGRYRQHQQLGIEVFGEKAPSVDAHVVTLALRYYRTLGLKGVKVHINSLGDDSDRAKYLKVLVDYLQSNEKHLAETDRERLSRNPLRVLDSKEAKSAKVIAGAPQILNHLGEESRAHLMGVLEYLDELKLPYEVDPYLVRGFDYATRTVFEFYGHREGQQSALGGGCRYNKLVQDLGGQDVPGVGFAIGVERVLLELEQLGVEIPKEAGAKVFVVSLGEPARLAAFKLVENLLDAGVAVVGTVDKDGIGGQLERANKMGVPFAVIIGQKEVQEETVILRDMQSGAQEMIPLKSVVKDLQQRFSS